MSDGTSNPARYFGQQVRRARRAAGWTITEFGQRIGYDPGQISRIETGRRPPTELFAQSLALIERMCEEWKATGRLVFPSFAVSEGSGLLG